MSNRLSNFRVVSVHDPAIDTERMTVVQMREYFETRDEAKITPFLKPGSHPVWFHIREIPRRMMRQVAAVDVDSYRKERAFLAGVEAVANLPGERGEPIPLYQPTRDSGDFIAEAFLDDRGLDYGTIDEIGLVCWDHSFLARKTARTYRVPLTSADALGMRAYLSAASNPSSRAPSSSATSPEESETQRETGPSRSSSDASSASPTDAGAAATNSEAAA